MRKQGWISVNRKLPNDYTDCWVCTVLRDVFVASLIMTGYWRRDGVTEPYAITHWRPLVKPKPPRVRSKP